MNLIELSRQVENSYKQYLQTTFYLKDPDLRNSFEEALNSGKLSKGPFLEGTPVFKRTLSPRQLFTELLDKIPQEPFVKALHADRKLYKHQEQSIRALHNNHNVVVATGTGSGKTESFLFPILLHLYQEYLKGDLGPGVRALILYPMNALANDQRDRLGEICKTLIENNSPFSFTFGQYIGETPQNIKDNYRNAKDVLKDRESKSFRKKLDNGSIIGELVFRDEMIDTPPNILLTNFSMLEYLLLRPKDSELFDMGNSEWWRFIVLDEAHQYRGSKGIEMGMLVRRLKQRLREGGRKKPFNCIATSATLSSGEDGKEKVAEFASNLFDEKFSTENIIFGETEPLPQTGKINIDLSDYDIFLDYLGSENENDELFDETLSKYISLSDSSMSRHLLLTNLLSKDKRVTQLRNEITSRPYNVRELSDLVFGDLESTQRLETLVKMVQVLILTGKDSEHTPLLSARYHFFLKSLEGAFISYSPTREISLDRKGSKSEQAQFEIALCRECGQHYLVGRIDKYSGKFLESIRDPSSSEFGTVFLKPVEIDSEDIDDDSTDVSKRICYLCTQCGEISKGKLSCNHNKTLKVIKEPSPEKKKDKPDQLDRCSACGYHASGKDPVREVMYGTDGPHSVIATSLFKLLPDERKKILAFADGRQEAAFFAWYLEDSYAKILTRNLINKISSSFSENNDDGVSLTTLAGKAFNKYKNSFSSTSDDIPTSKKKIWTVLYREFLTDQQRISLEGVGLIKWFIHFPDWISIPEFLLHEPWNLSEIEIRDLLYILFNFMRLSGAVDIKTEDNVSLSWPDLKIKGWQQSYTLGRIPEKSKYVRSWDGSTKTKTISKTRLTLFMRKILGNDIPDDKAYKMAQEALGQIWNLICQNEDNIDSNDRLLIPTNDGKMLNPEWWRVRSYSPQDNIFVCNVCGRFQSANVRNICARYRCPGELTSIKIKDVEPNHYRTLYSDDLPENKMRTEEHTAQLGYEEARKFQRAFKENRINVLSSSTTFELGVDLGDLDTVFLRNVPPESFNYAQRVGRAGRRSGYPGYAITFCRRNPHDLYHFSDPQRILTGKISSPVISMMNEKIILRHIIATALSSYFRKYPQRFEDIQSLFTDLEKPSGVEDFHDYLMQKKEDIEKSLLNIVPTDMIDKMGLNNAQWIKTICDDDSNFSNAQIELSDDYNKLIDLRDYSSSKHDYDGAKWANKRIKTISNEDVLSFLSRKAIIPKYGFPVDVVELDTGEIQLHNKSKSLSLQRDLAIAISEFAPECKLVANKKEYTSGGLKKIAEKEWPRKLYKRCTKHLTFQQWDKGTPEPSLGCGCDEKKKSLTYEYIIPRFGFTTNRGKPPVTPTARSAKSFTTRPFFVGNTDPNIESINIPEKSPLISLTKSSPGDMVVLCEGRKGSGFYICPVCGYGSRKKFKGNHKNYLGRECNGSAYESVSLGHEFRTDILRIQFLSKPKISEPPIWFTYSLAYAIVEGAAEVLEIPRNDLNATVSYNKQYSISPIVLYDNVPGGAGLVARLEDPKFLKISLENAKNRTAGGCGCAADTSCYGCLRNYRNQFAHQHLQRGQVHDYLTKILDKI